MLHLISFPVPVLDMSNLPEYWTPVYNVWPDLFGMRNQGRVFPELLFHEQFNRSQAHWHFSPELCSFHYPPHCTPKDGKGLKRREIVWKIWICIFDALTLTRLEQSWTVHVFADFCSFSTLLNPVEYQHVNQKNQNVTCHFSSFKIRQPWGCLNSGVQIQFKIWKYDRN